MCSLWSSNSNVSSTARTVLQREVNRVSSAQLFPPRSRRWEEVVFDHENCPVERRKQSRPETIDEQGLRNLRHKFIHKITSGYVATCAHCTKTWTNEEMIELYLIKGVKVLGQTLFPADSAGRLKALAVEYQNPYD